MNDPVISLYLKIIDRVSGLLPTKNEIIKFAYHLGRASNEMKKGIKSLNKNKVRKGIADKKLTKIEIE